MVIIELQVDWFTHRSLDLPAHSIYMSALTTHAADVVVAARSLVWTGGLTEQQKVRSVSSPGFVLTSISRAMSWTLQESQMALKTVCTWPSPAIRKLANGRVA